MPPLSGIASEMTQKPTVHDKLLELWPLCVLLVFLAYMTMLAPSLREMSKVCIQLANGLLTIRS